MKKLFKSLCICLVLINAFCSFANEINVNRLDDLDLVSNLTIRSITKDDNGLIWFTTDNNIWNYDGYSLKPLEISNNTNNKGFNKILFDSETGLWIGVKERGLLNIHEGQIRDFKSALGTNIILALAQIDNKIWVATDIGIYLINNWEIEDFYPNTSNQSQVPINMTSLIDYSDNFILVGSRKALYRLNKSSKIFDKVSIPNQDGYIVFSLYEDLDKNIWVSTDIGIYLKKPNEPLFKPFKNDVFNQSIVSIVVDKNNIWVGTFKNGLYKISKKSEKITHLTYQVNNKESLSSNYIYSLMLDNNGLLWVSTFTGGLNYINTNALNFSLESFSKEALYCTRSHIFNDFYQQIDGTLYIASDSGLIIYNPQNNLCINNYPELSITGIRKSNNNNFWLSTSAGVYSFNKENNKITYLDIGLPETGVFFTTQLNKNEIIIGTWEGLYRYNEKKSILSSISLLDNELVKVKFYSYSIDNKGQYYFATNRGVAHLNKNLNLELIPQLQSKLFNQDVLTILINEDDLYYGAFQGGLYKYNLSSETLIQFSSQDVSDNMSIHSLLIDEKDNIWAGTDQGIKQFNFSNNQVNQYYKSDGLQGSYFNINSAYKATDGKFYFGGRNGFNAFYPDKISTNKTPPNVILTDFLRFGKSIQPLNDEAPFYLEKPINDLQELTITHLDYVIGFEFSALDMTDPSRNKYRFKLDGFDPDWTHVNADNRRANYTNLPSGKYTFTVQGSNKDGVWNQQGKSIKLNVLPAPWLTWWAFTLYILAFFALLYWYWQRKNRANIRITNMLKIQVKERTQELQIQKNTVEQLLKKKNEMFANVSHEFRTPLTLILGPINNLLKSPLHSNDIQSLKMVNRNANRLLTMIEQLLMLAKLTGEEKIRHVPQLINHQILSIVEIFQTLAMQRNISLKLLNNNKAAINATPHTIDTVIGNLLSNAIKYTPAGGQVTVNSYTDDGFVFIEVTDTGSGLTEQQQEQIFNRFERLDKHANIDGVGIGLSIVKEFLKINNGHLSIKSEPGNGSQFKIKFKAIDTKNIKHSDDKLILVKQLAQNALLETDIKQTFVNSTGQKSNDTILIIEDNDDMRQHISDSLKAHFHCLLANRGKTGIALAIKHIPDIIICDVMMPEMDGFKVSRTLRSDSRTSHIPLILLTALHDKESRIKGWRENVDAYLTKPFDTDELLLQLNNVLIIRNILKKKAGNVVKAGMKISENIDLTKKDKAFIDQLNHLIAKNYFNPIYQRPQLASDMAVSEKQLQRKTKALIDKNPMELLREYRLQKAAHKLKEGYQVSIVCDESGFNSLSHFSQCFKAQYGVSPKVYQQTCNNN